MRRVLYAVLIARNEERMLPGCLESLRGVVDGIVVCDTGSTDNTRGIARDFGAHVVEHEWHDDFAEARNAALDAARVLGASWALSLDADERIAEVDRAALRRFMKNADRDVAGVRLCNWVGSLENPRLDPATALVPRLFRTRYVRWENRIHEQPRSKRDGKNATRFDGLLIHHFGYCEEFMAPKRARNLELALAQFQENPNATSRFDLARSLSLAGDIEAAADAFSAVVTAFDAGEECSQRALRGALGWLCTDALRSGDAEQALHFAQRLRTTAGPDGPARFLEGMSLAKLERFSEALDVTEGVSDVADGTLLFRMDNLVSLRIAALARTGSPDLTEVLVSGLAEWPGSEEVARSFMLACEICPADAGVALAVLPRGSWLSLLCALPAGSVDAAAEAAWGTPGADRVALLAWARLRGPSLAVERVLVWSERLVEAGAPANIPAMVVAGDETRPADDRSAAAAWLVAHGLG